MWSIRGRTLEHHKHWVGDGKGRGSATSRRFNDLLHLFVRVAGGALVLRVNEVNNLSFRGA